MRRARKVSLAIASCLVFLAAVACEQAAQPITITNININTNTNQGGGSGAKDPEAVPGDVTKDTATVTINAFGENCPAGVQPANENRKFRKGCTLDITVNPRNANGQVIHDDKAPPPDYFLSLGPDSVASFVKDGNPYNARLTGLSAGSVKVIAGVNGKRSEETFFEVLQ